MRPPGSVTLAQRMKKAFLKNECIMLTSLMKQGFRGSCLPCCAFTTSGVQRSVVVMPGATA